MMGLLSGGEKNAAVADNSSAPQPGCMGELQKAWKEGKFKTYARWGGVVNVVACIALCLLLLGTNGVIQSVLLILIACLIGILELPFCCTCLEVCRTIQPYMRAFEVYWIRGVFYIGLGIATFAIFGAMGGFLNIVFGTTFVLDGLCYVLAHFRGETHTAEDNKVDGLGLGSGNMLKAKMASTAMGIV
mmetsp:Transcript_71794/g.105205  ORF Transcript_71794/g.105205 Transcript_71794/m.105205 type:complete len:188 (-) Transcript_71794:423-986(-)